MTWIFCMMGGMSIALLSLTSFQSDTFFSRVFYPVFLILVTYAIAKLVNHGLRAFFDKVEHFRRHFVSKDIGEDNSNFVVLRHFLVGIVYIVGFSLVVMSVPELRAVSYSLFASAGVLALIVGFAAQKAFSNLVSGVLIAIFEPFRVGDRIMLKSETEFGIVEDITLRHTIIKTWDNRRIIIPNAVISEEEITNYSIMDEKLLRHLDISIAYDADIDLARKIMVEEALKHPSLLKNVSGHRLLSREDDALVRVMSLGDFAVTLRLYYWVKDYPDWFKSGCDLLESIKKRFDKAGIEIPYPHRTIVYKKDIKQDIKNRR